MAELIDYSELSLEELLELKKQQSINTLPKSKNVRGRRRSPSGPGPVDKAIQKWWQRKSDKWAAFDKEQAIRDEASKKRAAGNRSWLWYGNREGIKPERSLSPRNRNRLYSEIRGLNRQNLDLALAKAQKDNKLITTLQDKSKVKRSNIPPTSEVTSKNEQNTGWLNFIKDNKGLSALWYSKPEQSGSSELTKPEWKFPDRKSTVFDTTDRHGNPKVLTRNQRKAYEDKFKLDRNTNEFISTEKWDQKYNPQAPTVEPKPTSRQMLENNKQWQMPIGFSTDVKLDYGQTKPGKSGLVNTKSKKAAVSLAGDWLKKAIEGEDAYFIPFRNQPVDTSLIQSEWDEDFISPL